VRKIKKVLVWGLCILIIIFGIYCALRYFSSKKTFLIPQIIKEEVFGKPLKFAVSADIHLSFGNLQKALSKVKQDGAEFVIIAGDLTSLGKDNELKEAKSVLDASGVKYFVIPGNHDLWWSEKIKVDVFEKIFGKRYQTFKADNIKFILIDNGSWQGMGEEQMVWLKNELEECPVFYCLVFTHMPLNHPSSAHIMGEGNAKAASQAAELRKLFLEKKVKEVFSGHLHYSSSYELDGLKTTIVGSLADDRNYQFPRFLEVTKIGEGLEKREVTIEK